MKTLFQNVFFKMGMILVLILILLIPAFMVQNLIHERMNRQQEAVDEVSSKHAREQTITGPILTIPYIVTSESKRADGSIKFNKTREYYHILPENLNVKGKVIPEKRKRGLFEVIVYHSDLHFSGEFEKYNFENFNLDEYNLELDKAFITVGITDLKGVNDQVKIQVKTNTSSGKKDSILMCSPGVLSSDIVSSGVNIRYPLTEMPSKIKFDFDLSINGSEELNFTPIGKITKVDLTSTWTDPSFNGSFLPTNRKVDEDGFTANWKVLHLNRNYPQSWIGAEHNVVRSQFGVNLRLPVDIYQKSMRVAKYAILFIVLTYLVFFFVEILNKIMIHPIQYILVGIALILFYVLMLAFSEQVNFNLAYIIAATMTILLIFLYCRSIFKSWGLAVMSASILLILYTFIFIIIQMQDYALLFGSVGIFLILAVTMYFSKRIDWFSLDKDKTVE